MNPEKNSEKPLLLRFVKALKSIIVFYQFVLGVLNLLLAPIGALLGPREPPSWMSWEEFIAKPTYMWGVESALMGVICIFLGFLLLHIDKRDHTKTYILTVQGLTISVVWWSLLTHVIRPLVIAVITVVTFIFLKKIETSYE